MDDLAETRRQRAAQWKTSGKGLPESEDPPTRLRSRSPPGKGSRLESERSESSNIRVLSWNIDGLDDHSNEEDMLGRTMWIIKEINRLRPHVVFLQELIDFNYQIVYQLLNGAFHIFKQEDCRQPYFVAVLVHKASMSVAGSAQPVRFPFSKMGRGGVFVSVSLRGSSESVGLLTAHLESFRESASERKKQIELCWDFLENMIKKGIVNSTIFGGDLNIRDNEVPSNLAQSDAWIMAGRNKAHEFTWDLARNDNAQMPHGGKPRCRFDRFYVNSVKDVRVNEFQLVGTDRVDGLDRFASDHFGIFIDMMIP